MWWLSGIKIVWSVLTGGGVSGVVKEVGAYLGKVSDNKTSVAVAETNATKEVDLAGIQAGAAELHEQIDLAKLRWGWWGERYLMLAAALGPVAHSDAVYFDSIPFWHHAVGSWGIARAPGVYEGQELKVIAAVVGYSVARAGISALIGKSRK